MKDWVIKNIKFIVLVLIFVIEVVVTILGSSNDWWGKEINVALVFAAIMFAYISFFSYLNKDTIDHKEMRNESKKEHNEIKGALAMYKDIELYSGIVDYEGRYVKAQKCSDVEMWIISNSVAENDAIIDKIYKNLIQGVKYYYIIPNNDVSRSEEDLKITFEKIKKISNGQKHFSIKYMKDDLFDLMPTDIVDILYYCNTNSTDYNATGISDNMKVFISFQSYNINNEIYYSPIALKETQKQQLFMRMAKWKSYRHWEELKC